MGIIALYVGKEMMKEKLRDKINEILEYIISKEPSEITYDEFKILDDKLKEIVTKEDDDVRGKRFEALIEAFKS